MPQWDYSHHPEGTTPDEFRKILELRREVLAEATKLDGLGQPLPVAWRQGWKAYQRRLGRDRDGSLRVLFVVEGPRGEVAYTRQVRLVRKHPLPYDLRQG